MSSATTAVIIVIVIVAIALIIAITRTARSIRLQRPFGREYLFRDRKIQGPHLVPAAGPRMREGGVNAEAAGARAADCVRGQAKQHAERGQDCDDLREDDCPRHRSPVPRRHGSDDPTDGQAAQPAEADACSR